MPYRAVAGAPLGGGGHGPLIELSLDISRGVAYSELGRLPVSNERGSAARWSPPFGNAMRFMARLDAAARADSSACPSGERGRHPNPSPPACAASAAVRSRVLLPSPPLLVLTVFPTEAGPRLNDDDVGDTRTVPCSAASGPEASVRDNLRARKPAGRSGERAGAASRMAAVEAAAAAAAVCVRVMWSPSNGCRSVCMPQSMQSRGPTADVWHRERGRGERRDQEGVGEQPRASVSIRASERRVVARHTHLCESCYYSRSSGRYTMVSVCLATWREQSRSIKRRPAIRRGGIRAQPQWDACCRPTLCPKYSRLDRSRQAVVRTRCASGHPSWTVYSWINGRQHTGQRKIAMHMAQPSSLL